jgi:hypothetical protein
LERGFLGFGEALAKEQVQRNPVTEPKRSENPKRPLSFSIFPNGYSISENALWCMSKRSNIPSHPPNADDDPAKAGRPRHHR